MNHLWPFVKGLIYGLLYLVVILFAIGIILYIVKTDFGKEGEAVGFDLAILSAILGGLILAGGLLGQVTEDMRRKLKRVGLVYIGATIGFTVYGICFPIIEHSLAVWAVGIGISVGALAFALGTVLLILAIPKLWLE